MLTREQFIKREIANLKADKGTTQRCLMSTPERVAAGLCQGDIPFKRIKLGNTTCSPECQADKQRLKRWLKVNDKCRICGHGLPKPKKVADAPLHNAQA